MDRFEEKPREEICGFRNTKLNGFLNEKRAHGVDVYAFSNLVLNGSSPILAILDLIMLFSRRPVLIFCVKNGTTELTSSHHGKN